MERTRGASWPARAHAALLLRQRQETKQRRVGSEGALRGPIAWEAWLKAVLPSSRATGRWSRLASSAKGHFLIALDIEGQITQETNHTFHGKILLYHQMFVILSASV